MARNNIYMPQMAKKEIAADGVPNPKSSALESYRYLEGRRQTINDSMRQRPLLRLWDKDMKYIGQIAQEKSVQVEELMADAGGANIVVRRDNWLSDTILYDRRSVEDLHITLDPNPTKTSWKTRWGGKVTAVNAKRGSDGLHTIELEAVSNREHLKHVLAAATPFSPPEFQPLKMWMLPWNCRTALTISLWINLCRQYEPFLSIPTNVLNPGSWLTTEVGNVNPMNWPVQVQYLNPIFDTSRFEIFTSRWTDFHTASADMLDDAGCIARAYTWLEEDEDSPHPAAPPAGPAPPSAPGARASRRSARPAAWASPSAPAASAPGAGTSRRSGCRTGSGAPRPQPRARSRRPTRAASPRPRWRPSASSPRPPAPAPHPVRP
jgi:hypothetical protein